jgi:hypothetical protein
MALVPGHFAHAKFRDDALVARLFLGRRGRLAAAFDPATTNRAAQEFRLLMRLLEAVAATRLATSGAGFHRGIGLTILRNRSRAVLDRRALTISTIITVAAIIVAVAPIILAVAITEAVLIAPEGTVAIGVVSRMADLLPLMGLVMLQHGRLCEAVIQHVIAAIVVAEVIALAALTRPAQALAVAVRHIAALLLELLAIGHDDAAVVLGMLQVVLGEHRVAGRLRVASERQIFFGDMRRGAADLHIRTVGFETARKRILALPIPVVVAASAAILLSLPHCL